MSSDPVVQEARSSVKISQNAKGEAQVEVKVYDGFEPGSLDVIRGEAVRTYNETVAAVRT